MNIQKSLVEYSIEVDETKIDVAIDYTNMQMSISCPKPVLEFKSCFEDMASLRNALSGVIKIIEFTEKEFIAHQINPE